MPLAVSRSDGVTMLTLTSDSSSACPPLCQLLGALFYSPGLCSVTRRLTPQRGGPQAVLGALWILTALLHLGLGLILMNTRGASVFMLEITFCPVWLGVLFLFFGVICILTERFPRPLLVLLCGLLNLTGFALSITGIVWYSYGGAGFWDYCSTDRYQYYDRNQYNDRNQYYDRWDRTPELLQERCVEARDLLRGLTLSLRVALITLCVLDLSLGLSGAAFSFKALRQGFRERMEEAKSTQKEEKEAEVEEEEE